MSATVRTRWSSRSICTERSYRSPGPAVALAPVETGVRAGEHRREGVTRLGRRGAHRPREVMGRTELFQQFPGALLVGRRQAQHELITAVAAEQVGLAETTCPAGREFAQEIVAGAVPVPVVDLLEAVEIDDGEAEGFAGPLGPRQVPGGLRLPRAPVGQPGERIGVGGAPQALREAALHLGQGEHGHHEHHPLHQEPRRLRRQRSGARRDSDHHHVQPGRAQGQEVRGIEAEGDQHRPQSDHAERGRRTPGEQGGQQARERDPGVDRPPAQPGAQQRDRRTAGRAHDPEGPEQRDGGVGTHGVRRTDQAQEAAEDVQQRQELRRRPAFGLHGGHPAGRSPAAPVTSTGWGTAESGWSARWSAAQHGGQPPVSSLGTVMTSTIAPRRYTVTGRGWPMASAKSRRCRLCASATGRRAASSTRSPALSPARSAGEPGTTSTTRSPCRRPVRSASGAGSGAGVLTRPRKARRTRPSDTSAPMIRRVVSLIGTASPRPHPATAVLMPTTRQEESASAPPELPGLSAASVWMTSSTTRAVRPSRVGSERPRPLTTPAVTDPARPSGLPTATTSWPTRSAPASPRTAGSGVAVRARTTARSERGSAPTTSTVVSVPSPKTATPRAARATTCALVSSRPSPVKTTAEPAPPRPSDAVTWSAATCGVTSVATAVTMRE